MRPVYKAWVCLVLSCARMRARVMSFLTSKQRFEATHYGRFLTSFFLSLSLCVSRSLLHLPPSSSYLIQIRSDAMRMTASLSARRAPPERPARCCWPPAPASIQRRQTSDPARATGAGDSAADSPPPEDKEDEIESDEGEWYLYFTETRAGTGFICAAEGPSRLLAVFPRLWQLSPRSAWQICGSWIEYWYVFVRVHQTAALMEWMVRPAEAHGSLLYARVFPSLQ